MKLAIIIGITLWPLFALPLLLLAGLGAMAAPFAYGFAAALLNSERV